MRARRVLPRCELGIGVGTVLRLTPSEWAALPISAAGLRQLRKRAVISMSAPPPGFAAYRLRLYEFRTLLRSLSVVPRGINEKENQKARACYRQEQPCALFACPRLRGKDCQASGDRIDPRTFDPQEDVPLGRDLIINGPPGTYWAANRAGLWV